MLADTASIRISAQTHFPRLGAREIQPAKLEFQASVTSDGSNTGLTSKPGAAFLAKPFAPSALVGAVRDCIERRGAELSEHG